MTRKKPPDPEDALDPAGNPRFDVRVAHIARVYNYWLGGKDHFAADRAAAEQTISVYPGIRLSARANRAFLARTVRHLAAAEGIRQFLDIGTGLPTANNTHEVAQASAPESRIVYVDNDPLVLAHARALLTSSPQGATAYLDADLREVDKIVDQAAGILDFSQPTAIMLIAVLHYIPEVSEARAIVARLLESVAGGSFLIISHAGSDLLPGEIDAFEKSLNEHLPADRHVARPHDEVKRFFEGTELLPPGVVRVSEWRPDTAEDAATPTPTTLWGGVGRKALLWPPALHTAGTPGTASRPGPGGIRDPVTWHPASPGLGEQRDTRPRALKTGGNTVVIEEDLRAITWLRANSPAWRLLRAENAPLVLSFLHRVFVQGNAQAISAAVHGWRDARRHVGFPQVIPCGIMMLWP